MERGTLYQLRNALNRRNVPKTCKSDMNASEDFFELVVSGHTLVAVMDFLGMSSIEEKPSEITDSPDLPKLMNIAAQVVDKHVDLSVEFSTAKGTKPKAGDSVYSYACETLSLGLLYMLLRDAIKEGDGDRVLLVWKFLLLIFDASNRKNYTIEAFTLLAQYYLVLPPRLAEQLKWSRFINVHGLVGHNISCDLHMEHLNRVAKTAVEGLGANKSEKAIVRVGKTVGTLSAATENFDNQHHVPADSASHSKKSSAKDLNKVVKVLQQQNVFQNIGRREHKSFRSMKTYLIRTVQEDKLKEWVIEKFGAMVK